MNRKSLLLGAIGVVCAVVLPKRATAASADAYGTPAFVDDLPAQIEQNREMSQRLTQLRATVTSTQTGAVTILPAPVVTARVWFNGEEIPVAWEAPADSQFVRVACDLPTMTARVVRAKG